MKRHAEAKEKHRSKQTSYVSLCFTLLKAMLLLETTYLQMTPANPWYFLVHLTKHPLYWSICLSHLSQPHLLQIFKSDSFTFFHQCRSAPCLRVSQTKDKNKTCRQVWWWWHAHARLLLFHPGSFSLRVCLAGVCCPVYIVSLSCYCYCYRRRGRGNPWSPVLPV